GRDVSVPEAAASWYDSVYRPVMTVAERHRLAEHLPGWTETDVYLVLTRLWLDLDLGGPPARAERPPNARLTDARPCAAQRRRGAPRTRRWNGSRRGRARRARRLLHVIRGGRRRRRARSAPTEPD